MSSYDERDRRASGEDDGHTVADMSDLDRPRAFSFRVEGYHKAAQERDTMPPAQTEWQQLNLTGKERWMLIAGALKASLLIGLAYVGGLGLVVWLLIRLWS